MLCTYCKNEIQTTGHSCPLCRGLLTNEKAGTIATPFLRFMGWIMDCFVVAGVLVALTYVGQNGGGKGVVLLILVAFIVFEVWALIRSTTIGKKLVGLRVYKTDGRRLGFFGMLIRELIGKPISYIVFMIGYLWIIFDKDNQGWHDKFISSVVIKGRKGV